MARVTFAAKVIDASSRSFAIEIQISGSKTIKPNMTAVLKLPIIQTKSALVVTCKCNSEIREG